MNTHPVTGLVVVPTDGTRAGITGVQYATREAQRLGLGVEIVHVLPSMYPVGTFPVIPDGSFREYAKDVLAPSEDVARAIDRDVAVGATLMTGGRVSSIVECAREAALIVLGSHALTPAERFWAGSTVPGVAARATCPVVVVPEAYDATTTKGRVVVGVKEPTQAAPLLGSAFALADDLGSELVILHAWKLPAGYDDLVSTEAAREEWRLSVADAIESQISDLRGQYPSVAVQIEVVHGRAAAALVDASRDADRLVITRPGHGSYFHHLGATARGVLREAHCPVEVFPPHAKADELFEVDEAVKPEVLALL